MTYEKGKIYVEYVSKTNKRPHSMFLVLDATEISYTVLMIYNIYKKYIGTTRIWTKSRCLEDASEELA